MRIVISCDVLPCSLVDIYRLFRETDYLLVTGIHAAGNVGKFLPEEITSHSKKDGHLCKERDSCLYMCVCVCVCECVRARARARARVCVWS